MTKKIIYNFILLFLSFFILTAFTSLSITVNNANIKIFKNSYKESFLGNSIICGFITDFETEEPIKYAHIEFFIKDLQGNYHDYQTESNESGFYIIENVVAGYCYEDGVIADGYHFYWGGNFYIDENETVWLNISMYPLQPKTSEVCGYVYDNQTGEPIFSSSVTMHWFDKYEMLNYGGDDSDENGFYSIDIGAGSFDVYTNTEGYIDKWLGRFNISDYETIWVNFSLDPEIIIEFISPLNGFYFKNKLVFPFIFPIIISSIDIKVNVTLQGGNPIDNVEIIIDNDSKDNFTSAPYIYHWTEKTPFKFRHLIEVRVIRNYDTDAIKKLQVWKFF